MLFNHSTNVVPVEVLSAAQKVLLIDLENCPNKIDDLLKDLADYALICICYAQSNSRVPIGWLASLTDAVNAKKLRLEQMTRGGKNSADFGITFMAGSLMQEWPKETEFVIFSNDNDLDHTVDLLKKYGRSAQRIGTQLKPKEIKEMVTSPTEAVTQSSSPVAIISSRLFANKSSRPKTIAKLHNSIRSSCKQDDALAKSILSELAAKGAIKVAGDKLDYVDKILKEIATQ